MDESRENPAPVDSDAMARQLQKHLDHMAEVRQYGNESLLLGAACACVHALMTQVLILAGHVRRLEEGAQ